jgi:hypothetical protein
VATPWDIQKAYLEGLAAENLIQFEPTEEERLERLREETGTGPQMRTAAAGGADVIDLRAMAEELSQAR